MTKAREESERERMERLIVENPQMFESAPSPSEPNPLEQKKGPRIESESFIFFPVLILTVFLFPFFYIQDLYYANAILIGGIIWLVRAISEDHGNNFKVIHLGTKFRIPTKYILILLVSTCSSAIEGEIENFKTSIVANKTNCEVGVITKKAAVAVNYFFTVMALPAQALAFSTGEIVKNVWFFENESAIYLIIDKLASDGVDKANKRKDKEVSELAAEIKKSGCEKKFHSWYWSSRIDALKNNAIPFFLNHIWFYLFLMTVTTTLVFKKFKKYGNN